MELRQLEHFVTTADFGSTRRAAETLYTSQSSVSKNISMLEEELGVTLFVRSNRGVSLTEAGREFYGQAHTVLQNVRLMKQMGRQKKIQENQHILLSIHHDLTAVLLFVQHHKP